MREHIRIISLFLAVLLLAFVFAGCGSKPAPVDELDDDDTADQTTAAQAAETAASPDDIREVYRTYYTSGLVSFRESPEEEGFLSAGALSGRDDLEISVFGTPERILLVSRFDNLGKGASGAAIQNMNLVLGADEALGLVRG